MTEKAVFLDRDKTILIPLRDNYIYRVGDFYVPNNFVVALKKLIEHEYLLFVVTNQGRVAKGNQTEEDVKNVHKYMREYFCKHGVAFKEFAYCPHNPGGHVSPYNVVCSCRKPKNGLIKILLDKYQIDISLSWMIGDSERDIIAGKMSGLSTVLVQTGSFINSDKADFVEKDLEKAVERILS